MKRTGVPDDVHGHGCLVAATPIGALEPSTHGADGSHTAATGEDVNRRSTRVIAEDVQQLPLTRQGHAGLWIEGGWPSAAAEHLAHLGDVTVSIWEIGTGVAADIENDECLLVLQGLGEVRFEDGDLVDLRPGALFKLRVGERTEWTVLRPVRAFVVSRRVS